MKLQNFFSSEDIKKILTGIFGEQKEHNQIIFSTKMDEIFSELLENSINIEGLENDWKEFLNRLTEECKNSKYTELKKRFDEYFGEGNSEKEDTEIN